MKAIAITEFGDPDVLVLREVPEPEIQAADEVKIQLRAASVNPIDTKLRQRGTFFPERRPAILGCDGAGVVVAVGAAVQRFKVGDEVYFCYGGLGDRGGCYAEYTVVPEVAVAHKPQSLSFIQAAALPLAVITAWEALGDRGGVPPLNILSTAKTVLIHAGAGGVGHLAIQLARRSGAAVATTISSPAKARFAEGLGATLAINYTTTDWVQAVLDWTGGKGVDFALDTVGGPTFAETFKAARPYGTLATLLEPAADTPWKIARQRNLLIQLTLMLTPQLMGLRDALAHQGKILEQVATLVDRGELQVVVDKTFPLGAAADAHRYLSQRLVQGKVVLVP
ncbi:zinc-dependent alcohol dehydrogenase family protein [Thermosynechococcus sp.]|uniref:zinc-dependent alcohol dehydrogenase family protein n=1 Tax=Thermosynechococcus sp. TaxID=2814275 RepID=UPI003919A290